MNNNKVLRVIIVIMLVAVVLALILTSIVPLTS
ncbi:MULTISPECIES: stressosome-associated protein Prli42 [Staphylococcus]|uniref:Stressosome-associated protein Prli42 n=1 Tax=Staphylococcus nepalensis TaxID=214473 RepID=A0ABS3KZ20_9STAP|nr:MULTISPECIES: stressosome-associated protein Prli42 [Staphylococcus]MBO1205019.1 stressosome-associated protein Prli42 [Staphylococcus nepalensis]MBO1213435.1 stressosome-associated protein Prli42 [Staphylococcus nepalensis]MBO1215343.1 stressosome-associated protein Prli42 [Staphylococcus nepalensis]MBO1221407.1 stressosome-associated protein Prli42 [Staphylococcus nepalensis]MBO1225985.1 stressosome-associated protein Prli42 [Staphylococcus nepalensis]